ncbi:hypothetical protein SAMN05216480_10410 [Pustulibacterium marinum]|uniref:Uncharacterized protein n=1 Tax=Pustulibacterium marinum TaxID=1224947 RepID=A0A1I7G9S1_9FLAO|nr:hypothetical protein [Pustulibacterium marinum]SFU45203.1 hypothetical protein SAMN05216480_10410 [Pustulibacterium marinum]
MKHFICTLFVLIGFGFQQIQSQTIENFVELDPTAFVVGTLDSPRLKVSKASPYHGFLTGFSCSQQYLKPYFMEALESIDGLSTDSLQIVQKYASDQFLMSESYANYFNQYFIFQSFSKLNGQFKKEQLEKGYADLSKFTTLLEKKSFLIGFTISKGTLLAKNVYRIPVNYNIPFKEKIFQLAKSIGYKTEYDPIGNIVFTVTEEDYNEYLTKALKEKIRFEKNCQ